MLRANVRTPVCCLAIQMALISGSLSAADYGLMASGRLSAEYSDNKLLTFDEELSASGYQADISAEYYYRTTSENLTIKPGLSVRRFNNTDDLDSDDKTLDMSFSKEYERINLFFNAGYVLDTTLTSEIETTGIVQNRKERKLISGNPSISFLLSQKSRLNIGANGMAVEYEDAENTGLVDYDYEQIFGSYIYELSDGLSFTQQISMAKMTADDINYETTVSQVIASLTGEISEYSTLSADVGYQKSEYMNTSIFGTFENIEEGYLFGLKWDKNAKNYDLSTTVKNNVLPGGSGVMLDERFAEMKLSWTIWRDVFPGLSMKLANVKEIREQAQSTERDYIRIGARLLMNLSRNSRIQFSYGYFSHKYNTSIDHADANSVHVSFNMWID